MMSKRRRFRLLCTLPLLALSSCAQPSNIILVRQDSALYPAVTKLWPGSRERRVRAAVLEQLPLGSARAEIDQFIDRNFMGTVSVISTGDDQRALAHVKEPHIFIRALDLTGSRGRGRVEIYLLLTPGQRLKDVVVRAFEF